MDIPEPHTQTTQYTVCCLPEGDINHHSFEVIVEYRGHSRWAVVHHSQCLGRDGSWDYEAIPSEREDEWLDQYRFTEQEALRLAAEWAPQVTCNGMTVAEALAP